jgi:hypothetical protein
VVHGPYFGNLGLRSYRVFDEMLEMAASFKRNRPFSSLLLAGLYGILPNSRLYNLMGHSVECVREQDFQATIQPSYKGAFASAYAVLQE